MSILSALAVIVMFINISAGTYVLATDPAHKMNRLFFLQCMSLAVWALTAVIIYSSNGRTDIVFWYKISSFGFGLYYVFTLHLCLLFIRAKLTPVRLVAMYIPATIIIAMTWFSYTLFEDFIFTCGRWKFIPAFSRAGFYIYALYYLSFVIITVIGMIRWRSRAESQKEIHQSRIIATSYISSVMICTITDFILPSFQFYNLPALAPVLLLLNTGSILQTIHKYNFLTPVRDIFDNSFIQTYPGMALLVNRRRRIITVNNEFCNYFGCSKNDVYGMHLNNWFSADESFVNGLTLLASGQAKTVNGALKYSNQRNSLLIADCSVISDKFGDFTGILIILTTPSVSGNNTGTDAGFTTVPGPDADDEKMTADKTWGIDLMGRKMWYTPWPADENGFYRGPSADEIKTIYCISGEAANETLLYFEECGGDTGILVSMLNEHMADNRFTAVRADLLDKTRWYSNEFYFYFIMFTKKVIGRYDFHFGENSNEQLSEHHKIYEKGFMDYIPYGKTGSGTPVHDVTTNNVLGLLLYLEKVQFINTSDIISFINNNMNSSYSIDRDFYNNENIWCSLEFIEYGLEFTKILANSKSFFIKAAIHSTLNELRLGKIFFLIPQQVVFTQIKNGISKVNDIHDFKTDVSKGFARFQIWIKPEFNLSQYSKYLNASIPNDAAIYHGSLGAILKLIFTLDDLPDSVITFRNDGDRHSFTIEYRWKPTASIIYYKIVAAIILSIFAGFGLIHTGIITHCLTIALFSLYILYIYSEKNNLSERLSEYTVVSSQQLEALEKTSAELLEERNTLEQKVIERTRELAMANERLSELDRIKSNFFANISHEIRTPLTLMITPVEAVLSGGYNYKQDRAFFESIYNNGLRLLSLINNLLDFSRMDAGRMKMSVSLINITAMAASHAEAIRSVCDLRSIKLRTFCQPEEILIWADREKIDRVLANLLSNAVKFTAGGGSIYLSAISDDTGMCVLRIEDTGPGIPADKQESIFDRFSQVDSGPSRMFEGTGIGLAMVMEYVKLHDGTVAVESRHIDCFPENHGSVFTVKIPADRGHFQTREDVNFSVEGTDERDVYTLNYAEFALNGIRKQEIAVVSAETVSNSVIPVEYTILIVEDNPGMHTMLTGVLGGQYRIINANDGMDALKIIETEENIPDLILSDVMMPGMDGYELTANIRRMPGLESVPVILLTAKAEPEMKLEGFSKGATDYIVKPFNMSDLQSRIKAQLDLKSVRDRLERTNRALYAELGNIRTRQLTVSESSEIKISHVIDFINKNFSADISREGLAAAVDMNPDHLSRIFNKVTGKRLNSYINELRIHNARNSLIETAKTVIQIAMDSGFENLRTFNRVFRESEGMTPSEFREKQKDALLKSFS